MIDVFFWLSLIFGGFLGFIAFFFDDKKMREALITQKPAKEPTDKEIKIIQKSIKISTFIFLGLAVVLWVVFIRNKDNTASGTKEANKLEETNKNSSAIPSDVTYTILDQSAGDEVYKTKKIVLELNRKVTSQELEVISKKIRSEHTKYEKLFLIYLLQGMEMGLGYWAMTDFTPNMESTIKVSIEGEAKIKSLIQKIENKKGAWLDQSTGLAYIICEKNGVLTKKNADHSKLTEEEPITQKKVGNQIRMYNEGEFARHGEYCIIAENGNLEWYNKDDKKVTVAMAIK
jgi:hypothetical protein